MSEEEKEYFDYRNMSKQDQEKYIQGKRNSRIAQAKSYLSHPTIPNLYKAAKTYLQSDYPSAPVQTGVAPSPGLLRNPKQILNSANMVQRGVNTIRKVNKATIANKVFRKTAGQKDVRILNNRNPLARGANSQDVEMAMSDVPEGSRIYQRRLPNGKISRQFYNKQTGEMVNVFDDTPKVYKPTRAFKPDPDVRIVEDPDVRIVRTTETSSQSYPNYYNNVEDSYNNVNYYDDLNDQLIANAGLQDMINHGFDFGF